MAIPDSQISRLKLPKKFIDALDDYVLSNHIETNRTSFFKVLIGDYVSEFNIQLSDVQLEQANLLHTKMIENVAYEPESVSMRLHTHLSLEDVTSKLKNISETIVLLGLFEFFNSRM